MSTIKEYPFDDTPVTSQPAGRKISRVSIAEPADSRNGYDNYGFERNRKISQGNSEIVEQGPARKKSILHNSADNDSLHSHHSAHHAHTDDKMDRHSMHNEFRSKKFSTTESMYSKKFTPEDSVEKSWWFSFCQKCHQPDTTPSWEPPHWQRFCPYPMCPTYRQFAQVLSIILIGFLIWGVLYALIPDLAKPGGQLFGLAALAIAAHFGGWLMFKITTLPALIGMLLVGILLQNVGLISIDSEFKHVTGELRKVALVIILTRAGLDLDPPAMKKLFLTVIKLGLIPWIVECAIIGLMTHYLLGLPWIWAFMLGSIIAAVSPAVVVPCLFRLRSKGYGVAKGIPTLVLAVAGIDDAASVAIFGIISSIMFTESSLVNTILQGPLSIIGGIGFGALWGMLAKYVPEKNDPFVVPIRVLMLFLGGLIAVMGSELIGYGGAGPLAVIAASFVSCLNWSQQGWEVEDNPVATAFEIFWMIFEPILFGITGAQVKINELDAHIVSIGVGCLFAGIIIRVFVTAAIGFGSNLNTKEKFFVGLSWMAKATVQAALGPIALDSITRRQGSEEEIEYANVTLMICILSIVITAPLGAILISLTGPRLLTKTRQPQVLEGWRRSHRPSIRDISIIDEEEEKDNSEDTENGHNDETITNTSFNNTQISHEK